VHQNPNISQSPAWSIQTKHLLIMRRVVRYIHGGPLVPQLQPCATQQHPAETREEIRSMQQLCVQHNHHLYQSKPTSSTALLQNKNSPFHDPLFRMTWYLQITFYIHNFLTTLIILHFTAMYEVEGARPRGRPTWTEIVEKDCQARKLNREDVMNRKRWRKQVRDDWWPW